MKNDFVLVLDSLVTKRGAGDSGFFPISLSLARGQIFFLVGEKVFNEPSILEAIFTNGGVESGKICFFNKEFKDIRTLKERSSWRQNMGIIFRKQYFVENEDVLYNVLLPNLIKNGPSEEVRQQAVDLLTWFDMGEFINNSISSLDSEQIQKVNIARAIMADPALFLIEDPLPLLKHKASAQFLSLLNQLINNGKAILFVTKDRDLPGLIKGQILNLDSYDL